MILSECTISDSASTHPLLIQLTLNCSDTEFIYFSLDDSIQFQQQKKWTIKDSQGLSTAFQVVAFETDLLPSVSREARIMDGSLYMSYIRKHPNVLI